MAEIILEHGPFVKFVRKMKTQVFESADAMVTVWGALCLRATKVRRKRVFRTSIPMVGIGYSGIAAWRMDRLGARKRRANGKV